MKMRSKFSTYKRVVVKVGSSTLTGQAGENLDPAAVDALVDNLAKLKAEGAEVILVSSGAIAAGLAPLKLTARPAELTLQQAAASVGQGLLMAKYTQSFQRFALTTSQVLITLDDITKSAHVPPKTPKPLFDREVINYSNFISRFSPFNVPEKLVNR